MKRVPILWLLLLILTSCAGGGVLNTSELVPPMQPDYTDITLPANIAPLNFKLEGADALELEIRGSHAYRFKSGGPTLRFPMKK